MAQSFADFRKNVAGTDPVTVSPLDKKTSFGKFKSSYGKKEEDEEKNVVTPFDFSGFGLTDMTTKSSTPQVTDRGTVDDIKAVAKTTFALFKATREKEAFGEGFDIGKLQSAGAVETTLSRGFAALADTEDDVLPRGKHIPAFFQMVSDKLAERATEDFKLADTLNANVEHPETFSQAIQDPEFIARGVGQNLPNLLTAFGIGAGTAAVTKNPAAATTATFATTGSLEFGFAYKDAKDFGLSDEDADNAAATVGVANGLLDTLPITRALNKMQGGDVIKDQMLRNISRDIVGQMALESGTESLQEIVGNAVAQSYDENQELLEGVPEAIYFGALLGGGTTVATHIGAGSIDATNEAIERYKALSPREKQAGFVNFGFGEDGKAEIKDDAATEALKETKIVDEEGNPKVVYHGSNRSFEEFDLQYLGDHGYSEGKGFYFTDKKEVAEGYVNGEEGKLFQVFLDIKNPITLEQREITDDQLRAVLKKIVAKDPEALANYGADINTIGEEAAIEMGVEVLRDSETDVDLIADLGNSGIADNQEVNDIFTEVTGYDGVINDGFAQADNRTDFKVYVAFSPKQIHVAEEQKTESSPSPETVEEENEIELMSVDEAQEAFDRAEFEVVTEMELAEAGTKFTDDNGGFHVQESTFPEWMPPEVSSVQSVQKKVGGVPVLNKDGSPKKVRKKVVSDRGVRSSKLIKQVIDHFNAGTVPKKNATQQQRLLEVMQEEIARRIPAAAKDTVALQQIASQSPIKAGIVKKYKNIPVDVLLGKEKSPYVKVRETTLLKNRLRALASGAKSGLREGKKIQAQIDKVKADTKISELKRKQELKLLRQRLKDRSTFTERGLKEGAINTKRQIATIQKRLVGIVQSSDLDAKDKNKFMKLVTNIQTTEQLREALPEIELRILTLGAKSEIKFFKNKIKKLLKATKVKKQSGKPAGKFTADVQQILDDVKKYVKMSSEEGAAQIEKNLEPYVTKDTFPPDSIVRENVLIETFSGLNDKTVQQLEKASNFIENIIETGKISAELKKFNRSEKIDRMKAKMIDTLTGGKGIPSTVKTTGIKKTDAETRKEMVSNYFSSIGKSIVGWKDVLDMLSVKDKESDPYKSFISRWGDVLDEQREERGGLLKQTTEVRDIIRRVYDIEGDREVIKHIAELNKEIELGKFKNADGKDVELVFTRDEMIKRYMEMKDPTLAETFDEGMAYTQEIKDAITNELTVQDKAFAEAQLEFYRGYYSSVNNVYREMYGVNLPNNPFYSPIKREGVAESVTGAGDFLQDVTSRASIGSGSLKSRVKNVHPLKQRGSTSVMEQHVTQMEHFKAWAEKLRDMQTVFNDPQVRTAMELNHGRDIIGVVDSFLNDMARGSEARAFRTAGLDKLRARFSRAVLSVKPSIFIKQLTSFLAYADSVPVGSFTKGQIDFWKAPVAHTKFLLEESTMLKTRGQNINRDLAVALKSDEYNFFREKASFLNSLTLNIKAGDQGAIVAGGWSAYKHHFDEAIKNGKTEEEAKKIGIEEFERITESTQQSAELSEQSAFQRGGSIAKLFTMFLSTPNQYFRKELGAVRNTIAGRGSIKQHAKTIFIFHFMLPMLFQFVSDFFRFNKEQQLRAALLGSLNGWFIVGDALDYLLRKALGQQTFTNEISLYSISNDMGKAIDLLLKDPDEIDTDDVMRGIRGFAGATGSLTGTPLKQGVDTVAAVNQVFEGEYERGLGQFLGWSPYVVDQALKEDEEETTGKKKKKKKESTTKKKKKK